MTADFTENYWQSIIIQNRMFNPNTISFCSLLGVVYYLSKQTFQNLLSSLSGILAKGSTIVFDYPDEDSYTPKAGVRAQKQAMLANVANESMLASYSYNDMEKLLFSNGFLIYEHLTPQDMTAQYFKKYNLVNPSHPIAAFDNVNYCLAVKNK